MADKKEAATKKKFSKGDAYECGVCGMAVVVEEPCGCGEEVVLMCCDEPMKARKSKTKTAKQVCEAN